MCKNNELSEKQVNDAVLDYICNLSDPDTSIEIISSEIGIDKSKVAKSIKDLSNIGEFFFIYNVLKPGSLHITHIDGKEITWNKTTEKNNIGNGLFDRQGNIFINPNEFFEYISTLPSSTKFENEILFKELSDLTEKTYEDKVIEIATKNIKLIRRITFGVIENENLSEDEIREYYGYVLRGLCRSIEKFDYKKGFALSTLANQWILQGSTRARSKIIQKRMLNTYGVQVGLHRIDERAREIKNTADKYPTFDELFLSFEQELVEKTEINKKKQKQLQEDIEKSKGINKLYNILFNNGRIKFSYPTEEAKKSIFSALERLDIKSKEILVLRYGLEDYLKDYDISFSDSEIISFKTSSRGEKGMTLEEIGEIYDLTRERVRQVEKIAIGKMLFYIGEISSSQLIPKVFFTKLLNEFFELNNLKTINDVISLTPIQLTNLKKATPQKIDDITRVFKEIGFELKQHKKTSGDIDFSQLSVRSTNALTKAKILTKKQLSDIAIENIPNIGEKSVKELYNYLEQESEFPQNKEFFQNIQTALAFPCANKTSQQNFHHTMTKKIKLSKIENFLLPRQKNQLPQLGKEFYFWGIKSTTDKGWDAIDLDSLGLFFANKEIFAVGRVVYKFINQHLANYFWEPEDGERSYKYMFAFSEIKKVNIPQLSFNQVVGFKENYVTQGFMGLNKIRSRDVSFLVREHIN